MKEKDRLTTKQVVMANMALGVVKNAMEFKKALRRATKIMKRIKKVEPSLWRQHHPGFSRIAAGGWRGLRRDGMPLLRSTTLCTKKRTLGRCRLAGCPLHGQAFGKRPKTFPRQP